MDVKFENEVINYLANDIVLKLKGKINIEKEMKEFIASDISIENKKIALEQLYLFQLYSDAYIGPDPRARNLLFATVKSVLCARNEEDLKLNIEELKKSIKFMETIELKPLSSARRRIEDKEKYKEVRF